MKLSKEEVEHIALLSRIKTTEAENERFSDQLSGILSYVGQLSEVDTAKVSPTSQVAGKTNVFREDEVMPCEIEAKELLENAPDKQDGSVKVKAILE